MTLQQSLIALARDMMGLSLECGRVKAPTQIAREAEEAIEIYRIRVDELRLFLVAES